MMTKSNTINPEYLLVRTDGYSIEKVGRYTTHDNAHAAMKKEYDDYNDNSPDDEWQDMSSIDYDTAILYNHGEDVYVWQIFNI